MIWSKAENGIFPIIHTFFVCIGSDLTLFYNVTTGRKEGMGCSMLLLHMILTNGVVKRRLKNKEGEKKQSKKKKKSFACFSLSFHRRKGAKRRFVNGRKLGRSETKRRRIRSIRKQRGKGLLWIYLFTHIALHACVHVYSVCSMDINLCIEKTDGIFFSPYTYPH